LIAAVIYASSSLVPPMITQTIHLVDRLPSYIQTALPFIQIDPKIFITQIAPFSENVVKVTVSIFSNIVALLTIMVLSIYMLLERKNLEKSLIKYLGEENTRPVYTIFTKVEERLGVWVRGQIVLGLTIGLLTSIGLMILDIPYILPLAIIAGFLEIVPNIGPVVSGVPAVIIALTISPFIALATVITYFLIQQFENHLIVPLVMKKFVGLPPLVTIVAMLTGAKLAGIGGILLAVPIVVASETVITEWLKMKENS
jgi:predicted PurR-regulated permease PerM